MRFGFALFCALSALTAPALAEDRSYALSMYGVKIGQMDLRVDATPRDYALAAQFRTTGVVGILARVRFDMQARGKVQGTRLSPRSYVEDMDTGRRQSSSRVGFSAGDHRKDLLSTFWMGLRDRPLAQGCALDARTFDGARELHVVLQPAGESATHVTCKGAIRRASGYTPAELAERTLFPIEASYLREGDMLRFDRLRLHSLHGKATLRPR